MKQQDVFDIWLFIILGAIVFYMGWTFYDDNISLGDRPRIESK